MYLNSRYLNTGDKYIFTLGISILVINVSLQWALVTTSDKLLITELASQRSNQPDDSVCIIVIKQSSMSMCEILGRMVFLDLSKFKLIFQSKMSVVPK